MTSFLLQNKPTVSTGKRYNGIPVNETITNGLFTVNSGWKVIYWNRAAERLSGIQSKDITGKDLRENTAGIIPSALDIIFNNAFLPNQPTHFEEYWGVMGNWSDVISYHSTNLFSVSFKGLKQTDDEASLQLKNLRELYRFVTEISNDCLWEWDLVSESIFWIDGGHKRTFGYAIENALVPQTFWENNIHPDDLTGILAKLYNTITLSPGVLWEAAYRFKKADGEYAFVQDRGHIIFEDGKAISIVGATQDVTEKNFLENQLTTARLIKQKEITDAILLAQETERSDMGKELHDNLNQVLGATKLYIEMGKTDSPGRVGYLDTASGYIVNVIEEIRRISKKLLPHGMGMIGLTDSINFLLDDISIIHPIHIEFQKNNIEDIVLNEKTKMTLFRIIQEQMNNILKHASASEASVELCWSRDEIELLISDNGVGADMNRKTTGVGLHNIISRAESCHGKAKMLSKPGTGFHLRVVIPVEQLP